MTTLKDLEDFVRAMSKDGKSLGDFGPLFESLRWQPIDTAPLATIEEYLFYDKEFDGCYVATHDGEGWVYQIDQNSTSNPLLYLPNPTHWKPLDTPPEDT